MNPPTLTILTADAGAACDPETGACPIAHPPIPSADAVVPGMEEIPSA